MDKDKRKEGLIKIGCILVSFFLWIMVSSSNNPVKTTVVKNVKVNVVEGDALEKASLVKLSNKEFHVDVTIKGASTDVYSVKASDFNLQVDLNKNSLNNLLWNILYKHQITLLMIKQITPFLFLLITH